MSTQNCAVQVKIELGHRATVKKIPSPEGFTHDWTVYVRGPENCNISYFIEKVVFNLHGSFNNPKRVLTEPPYAVQEQGYAGFELPIDIYFKNKEDPKKIRFKYDLFLKLEDCPPVNHIRCEKLTFQNPTDEFKKKLLKAGGVLVGPSGEPLVPMGEFTEIFDAPISLDSSKRPPKSSHIPSKEKTSKEKSSSSSKLSSKTSAAHVVASSSSKDSLGTEERKEKRSPKEASQQKRSYDTSSTDGVLMKKPKRPSSVSSPPEAKVKEKHRSSEKKRHSKERDGSKSSKDPHKEHHKREVDSQEKDSRERDKEKFEKMKREHKEREGKKEILKHKSSSSVTNSPNPLAFKSHSAEKKDKHGSKNLGDNVKREKVKKSESSHSRKENREEKSLSTSKSSSLSLDKKVKEISKSLSKALDTQKRPSMATPESAPPKKKPRVEELFCSSSSSSEDEDEEVVKEIIEGVEKNKDIEESSDSSSSCDSELDEKVLNVWSSQSVFKLSPLSQHKVSAKSPSSIKNPSSLSKSVRSISPAASERSWSSRYSPTGSTHSHTSTSNRHSSSKQSTKEKDISKHSKESKSKKSSSKSSSHSSSSEKKDKETSSRSDKHVSKKSSTPNVFASEKTDKHSRSHSKDGSKLEKNPIDKKPKDVKLLTDMKSEKLDSVPQSFEKNEWKENIYKSEVPQEKFTNIKSEKVRSFSIESNDQMCLKKEFLSDDEESEKKENVAETFTFENGYGHLGTAPNGEDLIELLKLHQKLESMQDSSVIQRVVQEIEKTGLYNISEKTFDFDLCELDSSTVKKIHNFLCSV